jgi:hypothetical protein
MHNTTARSLPAASSFLGILLQFVSNNHLFMLLLYCSIYPRAFGTFLDSDFVYEMMEALLRSTLNAKSWREVGSHLSGPSEEESQLTSKS